jgi:hypothetical protein
MRWLLLLFFLIGAPQTQDDSRLSCEALRFGEVYFFRDAIYIEVINHNLLPMQIMRFDLYWRTQPGVALRSITLDNANRVTPLWQGNQPQAPFAIGTGAMGTTLTGDTLTQFSQADRFISPDGFQSFIIAHFDGIDNVNPALNPDNGFRLPDILNTRLIVAKDVNESCAMTYSIAPLLDPLRVILRLVFT